MTLETEKIKQEMGIGEYSNNVAAIICLRSLSDVVIFGLGA